MERCICVMDWYSEGDILSRTCIVNISLDNVTNMCTHRLCMRHTNTPAHSHQTLFCMRHTSMPAHSHRTHPLVCCARGCIYIHVASFFTTPSSSHIALIQQITDSTPISLLIKITWVLSIFCGHTHSPEHPSPYEKIKQVSRDLVMSCLIISCYHVCQVILIL